MPKPRTAFRARTAPQTSEPVDACLAFPLSILTDAHLTELQKNTLALIHATGNPSEVTLARWLSRSPRAIADAIRRLRAVGLLEVLPRAAGRGNAYLVRMPRAGPEAAEIREALEGVEAVARRASAALASAERSSSNYHRYCAALRAMREEEEREHHERVEAEWRRITCAGEDAGRSRTLRDPDAPRHDEVAG